jgi:hypothetical protein
MIILLLKVKLKINAFMKKYKKNLIKEHWLKLCIKNILTLIRKKNKKESITRLETFPSEIKKASQIVQLQTELLYWTYKI